MTEQKGKPTVLSVGRLYCDLIFTDIPRLPTLGTEVFAEGFSAHAGGGAFITAAYLSELGHNSALSVMLPSSPFFDIMRPNFETADVDLTLSKQSPVGVDPQITVAMIQNGDRAFLTRKSGPAFPHLSQADVARLGVHHIHIGELASLVEQPEILDTAKALGVTLSVDCGWDETITATSLTPFIGKIDVFLPNQAEWSHLQSIGLPRDFAPLTVVKQGSKGATALTADGEASSRTKAIQAVDTTGAGDAFNAGFLTGWLSKQPLSDCLELGNKKGAEAVRQQGGFHHERVDNEPTEPR